MFRNYFKTAWRNLVKHKFYSAINVAGLTIGLTVGILILLWVRNELTYDRFHKNADNIYRAFANMGPKSSRQVWTSMHAPLAVFAKEEVPEVTEAVRIRHNWNFSLFEHRNKRFTNDKKAYVDPSFFTMFDFPLLKGNPQQPFQGDYSVILTEAAAQRYFGTTEAVGKVLRADGKQYFIVAGVMANFPENSSIQYDMLFPMSLCAKLFRGNGEWKTIDTDIGNFDYNIYLQLQPGVSPAVAEKKLAASLFKRRKLDYDDPYRLMPLRDMHLYKADGSEGQIQTVRIFLIIGILILLIACINYVNLSTARAMLRAREVSVRKVMGAARRQLFFQFVTETALVFAFAMAAAMVLTYVLMPVYNNISGRNIAFSFTDGGVWLLAGAAVLVSLLLSSIYPALLLSSFEPLKALQGKLRGGMSTTFFRKALVTTQFVFSVALITGTLVIAGQLTYINEKELGYDKEHVFTFVLRNMRGHLPAVRAELMQEPAITGLSTANDQILQIGNTTSDTDWDGKDPNGEFFIHGMYIDSNFLSLMKLPIVEGEGFKGIASDSAHYILNETAVREAGITNPVGKKFVLHDEPGTIIGVVKDFHFASLRTKIEPAIFVYRPSGDGMYVRTTGENASKATAAVEKLWKKYNPDFPFEYTFLDQQYDNMYKSEQRTASLFSIFATVAVLISCLGLLGLAAYTAQVKTKEIGIRKVLGASVASILQLLGKDFMVLVVIAIVIATPLAWYGMSLWLKDFAYRVSLSWWMFAVAGLAAISIALLTVSVQSVKAALTNPVKSLRSE